MDKPELEAIRLTRSKESYTVGRHQDNDIALNLNKIFFPTLAGSTYESDWWKIELEFLFMWMTFPVMEHILMGH